MSVENITASILKDAEAAAENALLNANKTSQEIIEAAKKEAESIVSVKVEKAEKEAENLKNRKTSAAELQKRKTVLGAKQDAIKKSFDVALERLKSMPEDKYMEFLVNGIIRAPYSEGMIILNNSDRNRIGEKLIKSVNDILKSEKFTLGNETVNSSGGFILKSGSVEVNSTFETLLDSVKDELTNEIANVLF